MGFLCLGLVSQVRRLAAAQEEVCPRFLADDGGGAYFPRRLSLVELRVVMGARVVIPPFAQGRPVVWGLGKEQDEKGTVTCNW